MSILQAHLRLKFHTTAQQTTGFTASCFKQKSPAAHATLLRVHATAGPSKLINVPLAPNAYARGHLPAGLNSHAARSQGQQGGADQQAQNQGLSPAPPARQCQLLLCWQQRQLRQLWP